MSSALTIGNFDGVHRGHQRLIHRVHDFARDHGLTPSLLTFDPHPTRVVAPDRAPRLLTTIEERKRLIHGAGIQRIEVMPFTAELAKLTPEEFVEKVVVGAMDAKAVVVGHNFRFGHRASGDVDMLRELGRKYGFVTDMVESVSWRGIEISSSEIRKRIQDGDVSRACRMLGRVYMLEGEVLPGRGVGSKKTVPTLNLGTPAEVLPQAGVYITRTRDLNNGREWNSVTNVGYRPTFGEDDRLSIETFLLDPFSGETPARIAVEFHKRLREERKFEGPEALKAQIFKDVARTQAYFRRRASLRYPGVRIPF